VSSSAGPGQSDARDLLGVAAAIALHVSIFNVLTWLLSVG